MRLHSTIKCCHQDPSLADCLWTARCLSYLWWLLAASDFVIIVTGKCRKIRRKSSWMKAKVLVSQSCLTVCDLMDCSPPGSSVHGILQAKILEWGAIPFSRGSSWPRDRTCVSCIAGRFFTIWANRWAVKQQIPPFWVSQNSGACRKVGIIWSKYFWKVFFWDWGSSFVLLDQKRSLAFLKQYLRMKSNI